MQKAKDNEETQNAEQLVSKEQIVSLFEGFKKIFKTKVNIADYDLDMVKIWHIAINDQNMTQSEFNLAKRKTLGLEWSPTVPMDFIKLGTTASKYTTEKAFQIATQECGKMAEDRTWSDSLIYEASNRYGITALSECAEANYKAFSVVYEQVISEHRAGKAFVVPKPVAEITHEIASDEFAQNALNKLLEMTGTAL